MWKAIFSMDSLVLRGLLVAMVGLLGLILSFFGIDESLFGEKASKLIDAALLVITAAATFYAAYKRANAPNPNLTPAADALERKLIATGEIPADKATAGVLASVKGQNGSVSTGMLKALTGVALALLVGCSLGFAARDFNDRADIAYDAAKEAISTVDAMHDAGEITKEQASTAYDRIEDYISAIGVARSAYEVSATSGEEQLRAINEGVKKLLDDLRKREQS